MRKLFFSFALNDWPGSQNDLNGCINDQEDFVSIFKLWGFEILTYKNNEVTKQLIITVLTKIISELKSGDILIIHYSGHGTQVICVNGDEIDGYDEAWYVYDGALIDDVLYDIFKNVPKGVLCFLISDSCFSKSMARGIEIKSRFKPIETIVDENGNKRLLKRRKRMLENTSQVIGSLSGCMEEQTSADYYFNGRPNGALSYYGCKTLKKGISFKEWYKKIRKYLPSARFSQVPQLEGVDWILDSVISGTERTKKCFFKRIFEIFQRPVVPPPPKPPSGVDE